MSENIGIGDTKRNEEIAINPSNTNKPDTWFVHISEKLVSGCHKNDAEGAFANPAINSAFAGVGRPINVLLCLSSLLNLANLRAEKTAIKYAMYGKMNA